MRRVLLLCLLLPACVDAGVATPLPVDELACETLDLAKPEIAGFDLDLVLVLSDAPSMEVHREDLAEGLQLLAWGLDGFNVDLRVVVIGPGGVAKVVVDERRPWFTCVDDGTDCRETSYGGTLIEALLAAANLPAGDGSGALLQRLDDAFEQGDLFRPDALLGVFIISADDDESNWDPSDYAVRLARRDARWTVVKVVTGADAPRLQEFARWFPWDVVAIDEPDWSGVFADVAFVEWGDSFRAGFLARDEVDLTDVAPDEPGLQLDCFAAEADGTGIRRCRMSGPELPAASNALPCYWISTVPDAPYGATAIVERESPPQNVGGWLRCACATGEGA